VSRGAHAGVGAPPEHQNGDAGTDPPHPSHARRSPATPSESPESLLPSEERRRLRERLEHYILKAAREGKMRTSWTDRNDAFEDAVVSFLHAILDPGESAPFLDDLDRFARRIARPGLWNALSRTLLHLTVPGTPDLYQGDELWSFTLVDPDNRRPVDYALRSRLLGDLDAGADPAALLAHPEDGRIKLLVTSRILRARRSDPALWSRGEYLPLQAEGSGGVGSHIVSFARRREQRAAIVVAPRLPLTLDPSGGAAVGERVWGDAHIPLPPELRGKRWTSALTGLEIPASSAGDALRVAPVLGILPVALLVAAGTSRDG
jgi:(1->4)-alpha-D-glucan 1-alpha-D-glucosylmutase